MKHICVEFMRTDALFVTPCDSRLIGVHKGNAHWTTMKVLDSHLLTKKAIKIGILHFISIHPLLRTCVLKPTPSWIFQALFPLIPGKLALFVRDAWNSKIFQLLTLGNAILQHWAGIPL